MAAEVKGCLGHHGGAGKGFVDATGINIAGKAQVVAQAGVQHHGVGRQGGFHVSQCWQRFPLNLQVLQRILGFGAGIGHDCDHRLALPASAVNC